MSKSKRPSPTRINKAIDDEVETNTKSTDAEVETNAKAIDDEVELENSKSFMLNGYSVIKQTPTNWLATKQKNTISITKHKTGFFVKHAYSSMICKSFREALSNIK